jgi:HlyD family secretion protein
VRLATVERRAISPSLFGIGTVQARFTHKIGPIAAGRVKQVTVQPGDFVKAGQLLGEMDPVDLNDRIGALDASRKRAEANLLAVEAQLLEAGARATFAQTQAQRYEQLLACARSVPRRPTSSARKLQLAQASLSAVRANVDASRQELVRAGAEHDGLVRQRANLRLIAPVNGLVTRRDADSGTTVVAGQAVVEVVEPDQPLDQRALRPAARTRTGHALAGADRVALPAGQPLAGRVLRVEPMPTR